MLFDKNDLGEWAEPLAGEFQKPYFCTLRESVIDAYESGRDVYPPRGELFRALRLTPPENVRCVIVGQDPYHEAGQANGLSFSVARGVRLPPSLRNIYRELSSDLGVSAPADGNLAPWAEQGVLLLNTVLTVFEGEARSCAAFGWQEFTDAVLRAVNTRPRPVVFILWGADAKRKAENAGLTSCPYPRLVLSSAHPSPLSAYRGFFGSKPFSAANDFLASHGESPIDWKIV